MKIEVGTKVLKIFVFLIHVSRVIKHLMQLFLHFLIMH